MKKQIYIWLLLVASTLRISGVMVLGPFDENAAMKGAGLVPIRVVTGKIRAMGFLFQISIHGQ